MWVPESVTVTAILPQFRIGTITWGPFAGAPLPERVVHTFGNVHNAPSSTDTWQKFLAP